MGTWRVFFFEEDLDYKSQAITSKPSFDFFLWNEKNYWIKSVTSAPTRAF